MSIYRKFKNLVYNIIRDDDKNGLAANIFDGTIIILIILNIIFVVADTFNMPSWYVTLSSVVEVISLVVFTVEYIMRFLTADLKYPSDSHIRARIKYVFSFMAIIDLLAILPSYLPVVFGSEFFVLKAFRLFRLLRIFKFSRYTSAMAMIGNVFKRKRHHLVSSMLVIFVLIIVASVFIYHVENEANPDAFENAFSGIWWAVATFTTVGYGDVVPITALGKLFASVIALLGIGLVAVPTGIISAGFIELADEKEKEGEAADEKKFCPYCGHEYEK